MHREQSTAEQAGPPTTHELAVMVWLCVFPTLTALNLALADWLVTLAPVVRTLVLATVAVPLICYGLMPLLNRARVRLLAMRRPDVTARRSTGAARGR